MNRGNGMRSDPVRLSTTGQMVDLQTSHGANAYLLQSTRVDNFSFFSSDLATAKNIRKKDTKKKKLNASDRQILCGIYDKIANLAEFSDPRLFRQLIPESEIAALLNHFVEIYQPKTTDPAWINSGYLLKHDYPTLASIFALFKHPVPVVMVFEEKTLLECLSAVMVARQGTANKLPPSEFAEAVIIMTNNLVDCCMSRFDNTWTAEKVFKKLEAAGFLKQYLRCAAMKGTATIFDDAKAQTFGHLISCTAFVNKRFKEGTPCGDTVRAILEGKDDHTTLCPRALPYFKNLIQLSRLLQPGNGSSTATTCSCQYCKKEDAKDKLLTCSRCRNAHYCSKECQKADWKEHKVTCMQAPKSSSEKNKAAWDLAIMNTVQKIYPRIMMAMVEDMDNAMDKADSLKMYDMMLVLDFNPDSNGDVPMLQDPPVFQIVEIARYAEVARCGLLFQEGEQKLQVLQVLAELESRQSRKISTELICLIRKKASISFVTLDS
mmetsp:Transcript_45336/g.109788  ORF Transcript_45336/g.109788 Transcript_45336/m.109788 type:complete len:491 (+) Transcript_45336:60-1532(+)